MPARVSAKYIIKNARAGKLGYQKLHESADASLAERYTGCRSFYNSLGAEVWWSEKIQLADAVFYRG